MAEENKKGQGMKNQKGVTLISLTIYVIALTVIIAMLSVISTYFYKNVNDTQDDITPLTEFTNFNSYFTTDANTTDANATDTDAPTNSVPKTDNINSTTYEEGINYFPTQKKNARGLSGGAIAAIVICSVVALAIVGALIALGCSKSSSPVAPVQPVNSNITSSTLNNLSYEPRP